jgi:hypothetical protein
MIVSIRIAMQGLDERLSKVWVTYEHDFATDHVNITCNTVA